MVSTKHCCYGTCNSDSRYAQKPHMQGVSFLPFPKPITQGEKCDRWARACGRKDFDRTKITRNTYICTKHFVGGRGPTPENVDPVPAVAVPKQVGILMRKHKATAPPASATPVSKKQRTEAASALLHLSTSVTEDEESTSSSLQSADEGSSSNQVSSELKWHCACCKHSKENGSSAAPITKDQGTQTIYDKYRLGAKIESIIMKRREAAKHSMDVAAERDAVIL